MNDFYKALVASGPSSDIPSDLNYFGWLIGSWDFEWVDGHGQQEERRVPGEWIFSWVLEGRGIQDVFICPSRKARERTTYPDAAYGSTLRLYNPAEKTWDVFYGEAGSATLLDVRKKGDRLVLTQIFADKGLMQWVFSEITATSFRWQNFCRACLESENWQLQGELFAVKRQFL